MYLKNIDFIKTFTIALFLVVQMSWVSVERIFPFRDLKSQHVATTEGFMGYNGQFKSVWT